MPQFLIFLNRYNCGSCGSLGFRSGYILVSLSNMRILYLIVEDRMLICLQCSDNNLGGGDVSRNVLYEPEGKVGLINVVFSRYLSCIPSDQNSIRGHKYVVF